MADFQEAILQAAVAEMHSINARVEGMVAANAARQSSQEPLPYGEADFKRAEDELAGLANYMRGIYA